MALLDRRDPAGDAPAIQRPSGLELFAPGQLVELGGQGCSAQTTVALEAVRHAQGEGDTTAWIQPEHGPLFPPDAELRGIDLRALTVIQIPPSALPFGPCRAAELLLRSGGIGLVVLDLRAGAPPPGRGWTGRLAALARKHGARLIVLTQRPPGAPSLGPMVQLRLELGRRRCGPAGVRPARFAVDFEVRRNKSGAALDPAPLLFRGPWGVG